MIELEMITKILLMSCNEIVLVPLIIFGFLALDRKIFGQKRQLGKAQRSYSGPGVPRVRVWKCCKVSSR